MTQQQTKDEAAGQGPRTERVPITPKQAEYLLALDAAVRQAQALYERASATANAAALAILAGHDVQGRITHIDTDADPPVLVVEDD